MSSTVRKQIARLFLLAIAVLGVACGTPNVDSQAGAEAEPVPREIEQVALDTFAAEFNGKNLEIYGRASTTVGELRKLEPSNTSGWAESEQRNEDVIYAVFVFGDMSLESPPDKGGDTQLVPIAAGRMLIDETGFVLGTRFWGTKEPADPPFGEQFDDR